MASFLTEQSEQTKNKTKTINWVLYLPPKARQSLSIKGAIGSEKETELLTLLENKPSVFKELIEDIANINAKEMDYTYVGYAHGMMVFFDCNKIISMAENFLTNKTPATEEEKLLLKPGNIQKIHAVIITDEIDSLQVTTSLDSYKPATTKINKNITLDNYPAKLLFDPNNNYKPIRKSITLSE